MNHCKNCRFCRVLVTFDTGECRRLAPVEDPQSPNRHEKSTKHWPLVSPDSDWCGQWKKRITGHRHLT